MDALVFGILSHAQSHEICIYTNQNQHNQQKTMCLWRTLALLASSIQHFSTFWQHQTLQPLPKCKTSDTQEPTGESSRLLNIATFWVYYKYPINITTVYGYMYIYMYVCIYIYVCMYIIPHISIYCCFCWDPDPSLVKNQRAKSTTLRRTLFVYIIILQSGNEIDIDTESPWFPYRK